MSPTSTRRDLPRPPRSSGKARPADGTRSDASRQIALLAAQAGLEKKASEVQIIDVAGRVDYADFLVLMSGQNSRNVGAIARAVDEALSAAGNEPMSMEGLAKGEWVLIDFVDVVVHVFLSEVRSLYDLEGLWMDAARVPLMKKAPEKPKDE